MSQEIRECEKIFEVSKRRSRKKKEGNGNASNGNNNNNSASLPPNGDSIIKLNVGGRKFITRYTTLTGFGLAENFFIPLLSGRFPIEKDEKGYIFIDRNGLYFEQVLDFLRTGELYCPTHLSKSRLLQEAKFYGINLEQDYHFNKMGDPTSPLTDQSLKELITDHRTTNLEKNYQENKEGLKLVEKSIFKGFRAEAAKGKQLVVRFWPATETIISRCIQKWGDVVIHPLPPFMVNDDANVFDNSLYEVCKKGREGLCWHLSRKYKLSATITDSDYLTTHTYVGRDGALSINTYAWCVVSTEITHVYHAAEAVSIVWSPPKTGDESLDVYVEPPAAKAAKKALASKPFSV